MNKQYGAIFMGIGLTGAPFVEDFAACVKTVAIVERQQFKGHLS